VDVLREGLGMLATRSIRPCKMAAMSNTEEPHDAGVWRNAYSDAYRDLVVAADSLERLLDHRRNHAELRDVQAGLEQEIPSLVKALHEISNRLLLLCDGDPDERSAVEGAWRIAPRAD
jgi:hypothetical protein